MHSLSYSFLILLLAVAVAFPLFLLSVARLWFLFFQPQKPNREKNNVYECGLFTEGNAWIQFKAHYYLYAIIFLILDVEIIFLLPIAVAFKSLPVGALLVSLFFLILLAEGLIWAWKRGYLEWA